MSINAIRGVNKDTVDSIKVLYEKRVEDIKGHINLISSTGRGKVKFDVNNVEDSNLKIKVEGLYGGSTKAGGEMDSGCVVFTIKAEQLLKVQNEL